MSDPLRRGPDAHGAGLLVRVFLVATLGVLAVIAAVNYVVNPYAIFPSRAFPPVAWQSRRQKAEMLEARARRPEVLILGSSRTMKVAPTQVTRLSGLDAFNACVDSARAEDWTAMYRYTTEALRANVPEVIIGADVESFQNKKDADARLLGTYELRPFLPFSLKWRWYLHAVEDALSWPQLTDSLNSIKYRFRGYPEGKYRFDETGVLHYVVWEREIAAGTFKWDPSLEEYDGRLEGMTTLAPWRRAFFEELLRLTGERGARVRVFITPLHPKLLEHLRHTRDYDRLRAETVAYLQEQQRRFPHLKAVDFTEVSSFGGQPDGFLDGAHTTDENSAVMTEALWRQTSAPGR